MSYNEVTDTEIRDGISCPLDNEKKCNSGCAWWLEEYENTNWTDDIGEGRCSIELIAMSLWKPLGVGDKVRILFHDWWIDIRRIVYRIRKVTRGTKVNSAVRDKR